MRILQSIPLEHSGNKLRLLDKASYRSAVESSLILCRENAEYSANTKREGIIMKKIATAAAAFLSAATMSFSAAAPAFSNMAVTNVSAADTSGDDWLHAEGSRLYDMGRTE